MNRKVLAALAVGLTPIVCVGETLDERQAGQTAAVVREQIEGSLAGLDGRADASRSSSPTSRCGPSARGWWPRPSRPRRCMLTFADCWKAATIRKLRRAVRIQYGGSVNAENAASAAGPAEYRRGPGRRGVAEGGELFGDCRRRPGK